MLNHPMIKLLPLPTIEVKFIGADISNIRVLEDWVALPLEVGNGSVVFAGFHVDLVSPISNALQVGLDRANELRFAKGREPISMLVTNPASVTHFEVAPGKEAILLRVRSAGNTTTDYLLSIDTLQQLSKAIEDATVAISLQNASKNVL